MDTARQFERVAREWSAATGSPVWEPENDFSVEVDGRDIGLVYDAESDPDFINVYCDLGPPGFEGVHARMLRASADPRGGTYSLSPNTGNVFYRMRLPLCDELNGADLPHLLGEIAASGAARLVD